MGLEINLTLSVELSVAYDRSNTTVASKGKHQNLSTSLLLKALSTRSRFLTRQ